MRRSTHGGISREKLGRKSDQGEVCGLGDAPRKAAGEPPTLSNEPPEVGNTMGKRTGPKPHQRPPIRCPSSLRPGSLRKPLPTFPRRPPVVDSNAGYPLFLRMSQLGGPGMIESELGGNDQWVPQGSRQSSSSVTTTEWRSQRGYLASLVSSLALSRSSRYLPSVYREAKLVPDDKVIVRFRVDKRVWRALNVAASRNDLTVSDYLGVVLEQAVSKSAPREVVKPRAPHADRSRR